MVESGTRRKVPALNRHPASAVSGYLSSGGRTSSLPSRQVDKAGEIRCEVATFDEFVCLINCHRNSFY
jgi:hypothetical protein